MSYQLSVYILLPETKVWSSFRNRITQIEEAIKLIDTPKYLGVLAELLIWLPEVESVSRPLLYAKLVELLPLISETDYASFSMLQKECLHKLFKRHTRFAITDEQNAEYNSRPQGVPVSDWDIPMSISLLKAILRIRDRRYKSKVCELSLICLASTTDNQEIKRLAEECCVMFKSI